jgi:hypothetical protein
MPSHAPAATSLVTSAHFLANAEYWDVSANSLPLRRVLQVLDLLQVADSMPVAHWHTGATGPCPAQPLFMGKG